MIEPGAINTNPGKAGVISKKVQDPNSLHDQMTKNFHAFIQQMIVNGSPPELVAKLVYEAVSSKDPKLRYVAGKMLKRSWKLGIKCQTLNLPT